VHVLRKEGERTLLSGNRGDPQKEASTASLRSGENWKKGEPKEVNLGNGVDKWRNAGGIGQFLYRSSPGLRKKGKTKDREVGSNWGTPSRGSFNLVGPRSDRDF